MTPEGRVKSRVRKLLARYQGVFTYWPVPGGFGRATLDVFGCYRGRFFVVEVKRDGAKPTLRQTQEMSNVEAAMGKAFVIAGEDDPRLMQLEEWLNELTDTIDDDPHFTLDEVRRRTI
jgi:hypothetical protein